VVAAGASVVGAGVVVQAANTMAAVAVTESPRNSRRVIFLFVIAIS
jgi:hypothetical protein